MSEPSSTTLRDAILAAASGERSALFRLFAVLVAAARLTVRCLTDHYNACPHSRTLETYARLKYCLSRIPALLYTLKHAPERFLKPAQLRAILGARAVLSHICRQPVDFSPLWPWLTAPEHCPPPPRSCADAPIGRPAPSVGTTAATSSEGPASSGTDSNSQPTPVREVNPLLLQSPGRTLAAVFLQLAAIYGVSSKPVSVPPASAVQSAVSESHPVAALSIGSNSTSAAAANASSTFTPAAGAARLDPQSSPHPPP